MIRDEVKAFKPYRVIEGNYRIWLDKNESPYDLPEELKEEIFEELKRTPFNRYPHITSMPVREEIGDFYGLPAENVAVGKGGDELINYLVRLFEGDYIVTTPPTFGMYPFYARLNGIPVVEVPLREDFTIDGDTIAEKAKKASAVFIASPNNPTGNLQPLEEVLKVLETGRAVVVDEAYVEFAGKDLLGLLDEYPNLVLLRTFSKAFGLAGARIGYALASEEIIDALYRIKSPFSVDIFAQAVVKVVLRHPGLFRERVREIVKERERVRRSLGELAYPSDANFLLVKADAHSFLLERGIVVRKLSGRLKGHIRVTIGRREENDAFIAAMEEWKDVAGI